MIVEKSFLKSAGKLSKAERGLVFDFMAKCYENPANPGQSLERVQGALDNNIWSARINQDLRAILHQDGDRVILLWADHHDAAYRWAERRRVPIPPPHWHTSGGHRSGGGREADRSGVSA